MTETPLTPAEERRRVTERERSITQIMGRCKHFTGIQRKVCEAEIAYATVKDTSRKPFGLPCLPQDFPGGTSCPSACFPTREEAEAQMAEMDAFCERVGQIREAIVTATGGERGIQGEIPCPCCGSGTVTFSISGYNGHIHAHCSTAGCAEWME
jgi:hypothetical protein